MVPVLVIVRDIRRISVFGSDNSANLSLAEVLRLLPLAASPPAETAETPPIAVAGAGAVGAAIFLQTRNPSKDNSQLHHKIGNSVDWLEIHPRRSEWRKHRQVFYFECRFLGQDLRNGMYCFRRAFSVSFHPRCCCDFSTYFFWGALWKGIVAASHPAVGCLLPTWKEQYIFQQNGWVCFDGLKLEARPSHM